MYFLRKLKLLYRSWKVNHMKRFRPFIWIISIIHYYNFLGHKRKAKFIWEKLKYLNVDYGITKNLKNVDKIEVLECKEEQKLTPSSLDSNKIAEHLGKISDFRLLILCSPSTWETCKSDIIKNKNQISRFIVKCVWNSGK